MPSLCRISGLYHIILCIFINFHNLFKICHISIFHIQHIFYSPPQPPIYEFHDSLSVISLNHYKQHIKQCCQNANGKLTSPPAEKTASPDVSVTLKLAPSHPLILMVPFTLPSSDVKASSPFPLSTNVPFVSPSL